MIPTMYDPNQALWMVRISMGSQFKGKSKDIDDYTREIKYVHHKSVRREIGAIRQIINARRAAGSMPFFGAYITNQIGKDQLIEACAKADLEMKAIDPSLHVTPLFLKIDLPDLASGSQFDVLLSSIRTQIHEVALKRIKDKIENSKSETMTAKTKKSLITMLDKLTGLNIVNDPGITADIEKMRARINADQLKELKDEIMIILSETNDRGAALEIVSDIKITTEETEQSAPVLLAIGKKKELEIL